MRECTICFSKLFPWQKQIEDAHIKCLVEEVNNETGCEECGGYVDSKNINSVKQKNGLWHYYHAQCPITNTQKEVI